MGIWWENCTNPLKAEAVKTLKRKTKAQYEVNYILREYTRLTEQNAFEISSSNQNAPISFFFFFLMLGTSSISAAIADTPIYGI